VHYRALAFVRHNDLQSAVVVELMGMRLADVPKLCFFVAGILGEAGSAVKPASNHRRRLGAPQVL
jgi:hypothetical protein